MVAGRTQLDLGMEVAEEKFFDVTLEALGHTSSLTQKVKIFDFQITRTYQYLYRKSDNFPSWQDLETKSI